MGSLCLRVAALLAIVPAPSPAVETGQHAHWFISAGPSAILLSNAAHDDLAGLSAPAGTGRGVSVHLGYEISSHFAMRLAVHRAQHGISGPGTGGTASAAVDGLLFRSFGTTVPYVFARVGKQAFVLSRAQRGMAEALRDHSWNGHIVGGGVGVRWLVTRRLSVAPEASLCRTRYNKVMSTDGTGTQLPLDPISGTTGSASLLIGIHW